MCVYTYHEYVSYNKENAIPNTYREYNFLFKRLCLIKFATFSTYEMLKRHSCNIIMIKICNIQPLYNNMLFQVALHVIKAHLVCNFCDTTTCKEIINILDCTTCNRLTICKWILLLNTLHNSYNLIFETTAWKYSMVKTF